MTFFRSLRDAFRLAPNDPEPAKPFPGPPPWSKLGMIVPPANVQDRDGAPSSVANDDTFSRMVPAFEDRLVPRFDRARPDIPADDVSRAITKVVANADAAVALMPHERRIVRLVASQLERALNLPHIHG